MLSTKMADILRADLAEISSTAAASITEVKHLSSYNWIEAPEATIAVPGSPALWSPPKTPQRVAKDSGLIYSAQNAARHPESPLEPLFRSLHITNPSFDFQSVDLVTDRNNIRKLLSFINPSLSKNGLEPFTIKVEVIKDIAVFCRSEAEVSRFIGPHEFVGYGHEFEKAYTIDQCTDSTGHHRFISYQFGGLKLIVRYETDGYVGNEPAKSKEIEGDDLTSLIKNLSLGPTSSTASPAAVKSKLMIRKEGKPVLIESTLEIKTRTAYKHIDIEEVLPQLWVSQTPNLVRAYHRQGVFAVPQVKDVTLEIKRWEENRQADLKKLTVLIKRIISVVKANGGSGVVKYDIEQGDKLVISQSGGKKLLPDDVYSRLGCCKLKESKSNLPK
ncbi:conserved hypothetical protein [Talaromyces marneffei ATCC 18224]|uniref:Geranylgeranyl pyrophosphate synthetase n=1 Tax=Talaromyces marneffei (strain ATCC 18224 / CBS 334.59 / QM 7333) TaxID=441960 RepID=B6Q9S3_TALMQ|nr:conserved hypothetical protein [Talaromyces marneffei ATCC 18224]